MFMSRHHSFPLVLSTVFFFCDGVLDRRTQILMYYSCSCGSRDGGDPAAVIAGCEHLAQISENEESKKPLDITDESRKTRCRRNGKRCPTSRPTPARTAVTSSRPTRARTPRRTGTVVPGAGLRVADLAVQSRFSVVVTRWDCSSVPRR